MNRPRIFISAVSEELSSARQTVSATVRTLGFDPVSQDDFPTGHGELKQWLRKQIDSSEGLIQFVGNGYGSEPDEIDSDFGRVSYTQYEFFMPANKVKRPGPLLSAMAAAAINQLTGSTCRRITTIPTQLATRQSGQSPSRTISTDSHRKTIFVTQRILMLRLKTSSFACVMS